MEPGDVADISDCLARWAVDALSSSSRLPWNKLVGCVRRTRRRNSKKAISNVLMTPGARPTDYMRCSERLGGVVSLSILHKMSVRPTLLAPSLPLSVRANARPLRLRLRLSWNLHHLSETEEDVQSELGVSAWLIAAPTQPERKPQDPVRVRMND